MKTFVLAVAAVIGFVAMHSSLLQAADAQKRPTVGDIAPDFTLKSIDGSEVTLSKLAADGPLTLVVLRGYPGYQCPLCTKQVGSFMGRATDFTAAGSKVIFVYPGPAADLEKYAAAFAKTSKLSAPYTLLLDPDFGFTNAYNLRWSAPRETAYPSTFVLNRDRKVLFSKTSMTHGDRADVDEVLKTLKSIK